MKFLSGIARWLFILCLPVLLFTASIAVAVNSLWLYERGFEKYGVSQTTGLSQGELRKAAIGLIHYFNSGDEYIDVTVIKDGKPFTLFNEREVIHLKDVKKLFWLDYWVLLGTLIYALIFAGMSLFWWKDRRQLAWGLVGGSGLALGLILLLGVLGAIFSFNQLYLLFHFVSFSNPFWQLDPTRDYLIRLVTPEFQFDMAVFCGIEMAVGAVVLGGVGVYLWKIKTGD